MYYLDIPERACNAAERDLEGKWSSSGQTCDDSTCYKQIKADLHLSIASTLTLLAYNLFIKGQEVIGLKYIKALPKDHF
jgi:hypothetical protein